MDHKDLRWQKAQGPSFNVGDWVEIFSNSNQVWCPGKVTFAAPGQLRVAFHVPGGDVNDWNEKDLPAGSQEIRHVGSGGAEVRKLVWTVAEEDSYGYAFQSLTTDGKVSLEQLTKFLARARLEESMLKEVMGVANPSKKRALNQEEFFVCCRLVGHCLEIHRDPKLSQVLRDTGVPLRLVLQTQFLYTPPPQGPKFPGPPPKVVKT